VAARKARGHEPLTFGMTFPFSTHNYHLRFWMAAGGVDPDEDVRLVVLPPPYMVESLANKHVDAFCVGAPWNSIAVDLGIGFILHFVSEILPRAAEKVLAFQSRKAREYPDVLARLVRAHARAAEFVEEIGNRDEVAAILSAPNRIGVAPEVIRRTLDGRLKVSPDGATRRDANYLLIGRDGADRPDPVQAAWLYAQMVRWGQAPLSDDMCRAAMGVFRPDLYDAAVGAAPAVTGHTNGRVDAFAGPAFDAGNISAHLSSWRIGRVPVP
jgi:two-component system, oxyanion-binding sensor